LTACRAEQYLLQVHFLSLQPDLGFRRRHPDWAHVLAHLDLRPARIDHDRAF
jgi:hypothetical protein